MRLRIEEERIERDLRKQYGLPDRIVDEAGKGETVPTGAGGDDDPDASDRSEFNEGEQ